MENNLNQFNNLAQLQIANLYLDTIIKVLLIILLILGIMGLVKYLKN